MIIKYWNDPPEKLRSKLFWAWNGSLNKDIVADQIDCMRQMGLGGFYIHSRNGLKTPYLGESWFEMVNFALDEADKAGLDGAFYDEDRWPSGAAGGLIAAKFPELAASSLRRKKGGTMPENTIFSTTADGETWFYYVEKHTPSEWFNNSTFPDVFNPETARRFLELTHEKYLKECAGNTDFGGKEIFMDEPFYGLEVFRFGQTLPWTPALPELYREKFHEDLIPQLPGLFAALPDDSHIRIRWQFHLLLSELFRENFLRPIAQWCEEHGLKLTGHLLGEDTLITQAGSHGSNMAALQYFHQPGIDYLTAQRRHPLSIKQLVSTARQLGRRERLAEIYGCTGWEFSLYDQRRQGDMFFALGVNRRCLHLGWYSAEGVRKRDFPGSLTWHSSGNPEYARLESRFGRLHAIFEQCRETRNILLLNPVESAYCCLQEQYDTTFQADALENSRCTVADALFNANLDFDCADEELLALYASIQPGLLQIGEASYRAVILPESITLRRSTVEVLKRFTDAGGKLFIAGALPGFIDGKAATVDLGGKIVSHRELADELAFCRQLSLAGDDGRELPGLLHLLMRHEKGFFLFIHNTGYSTAQMADATNWRGAPLKERVCDYSHIKIKLAASKGNAPLVFDADSGNIYAGSTDMPLAAGESAMLFFPDEAETGALKKEFSTPVTPENRVFPVTLNEPNVLLFDRAEAADKSGRFHAPVDMLRLDAMFRSQYALPSMMSTRRQPWAEPDAGKDHPVTLRFTFFCDEVPQGKVLFATEDAEAQIFCNGEVLEKTDAFWFDRSLNFFTVKNLRSGENHIIMHTRINYHKTLENCFLLGDFGVKIAGFDLHMTAPVKSLTFGNWCDQGLPFYSGAVDYRMCVPAGANRKLDLEFKCSYASIMESTDRQWHEKGALVIPENLNEITLRLYGSRRNSHGPFHVVQQLRYCNPASFIPLREEFHPFWQLEEYGIFTIQEN